MILAALDVTLRSELFKGKFVQMIQMYYSDEKKTHCILLHTSFITRSELDIVTSMSFILTCRLHANCQNLDLIYMEALCIMIIINDLVVISWKNY